VEQVTNNQFNPPAWRISRFTLETPTNSIFESSLRVILGAVYFHSQSNWLTCHICVWNQVFLCGGHARWLSASPEVRAFMANAVIRFSNGSRAAFLAIGSRSNTNKGKRRTAGPSLCLLFRYNNCSDHPNGFMGEAEISRFDGS
jgi:hypothetical protein